MSRAGLLELLPESAPVSSEEDRVKVEALRLDEAVVHMVERGYTWDDAVEVIDDAISEGILDLDENAIIRAAP